MQIQKATKKQRKARIALVGPSGSGKTMSALLLAKGIGDKILVIDTENRTAENYVGHKLVPFDFDVINIDPPFKVQKYLEAIMMGEEANYDVIIVDSISHAWEGEGGVLDVKDKIDDAYGGNSFSNWRKVTPLHNKLVNAMVFSKTNIIATMRSKTAYTMEENEKGKVVPRRVGLAPVQRAGTEYEFTIVFDVDMSHVATSGKDRTGLFEDLMEPLSPEVGKVIAEWCGSGESSEYDTGLELAVEKIEQATSIEALTQVWKNNPGLHSELQAIFNNKAKEIQEAEQQGLLNS